MSEWKKVKLGEITNIKTGKLDSNAAVSNGAYPFFTCDPTTLRIDNWAYDTEAILLAGNNASGNYTAKYYNGKFNAYQRTYIIETIDSQIASVRFLAYAMNQQLQLLKVMSSGSTTKFLTMKMLTQLSINLPTYEIQRSVATILSRYDSLIENYQKQIKLLEEAAQRLYKEWFVDFRFPGHEHTKIIDGVPDGWTRSSLEEICSVSKKVISPSNIEKGRPYIGLEHIPRKDFCLSVWGNSEDISSSKYEYKENDILFGKIRPYFHKVGFAINNGYASTDSIIMQSKLGLWGLLLMTVYSDRFVKNTSQACKEGAKMPRADWNQMKKYPILIASDNVQYTFERYIKITANRIKEVATQIRLLTEARDRLLPKLMSGEIAV